MPTLCIITFNESPVGVYYAGQTLSGKVCLTTDRIKTIRGIYIKINGFAQVIWNELSNIMVDSSGWHDTPPWYHAHEDYFQSRVDVLNAPDGDRFELMPGNHQYNFQVILPPNLPSSFISQYGTIAYEVKCIIDRPWKYDNVFKHRFTILAPLDLNTDLSLTRPVIKRELTVHSKTCLKILRKKTCGSIWVKGYIPLGGFAPGQSIPVTMSVESQLTVTCSETIAGLMQQIEYTSYTPTRTHALKIRPVAMSLFGTFKKNEKKDLSCEICIPSVPPTSLTSCNPIKISYFVVIELQRQDGDLVAHLTLPITIGTVPYYDNNNQTADSIPMSSHTTVNSNATPAYEEAFKVDRSYMVEIDEDEHTPRVDFVPRYPVYNCMVNMTSPALGN